MKAAVINDPVDGFVTVKDVQLRDLKPGEWYYKHCKK